MKKLLLLASVIGLLSGCLYVPYDHEHGWYSRGDRGDRGGDRGEHGGDRQGGGRGD